MMMMRTGSAALAAAALVLRHRRAVPEGVRAGVERAREGSARVHVPLTTRAPRRVRSFRSIGSIVDIFYSSRSRHDSATRHPLAHPSLAPARRGLTTTTTTMSAPARCPLAATATGRKLERAAAAAAAAARARGRRRRRRAHPPRPRWTTAVAAASSPSPSPSPSDDDDDDDIPVLDAAGVHARLASRTHDAAKDTFAAFYYSWCVRSGDRDDGRRDARRATRARARAVAR